MNEIDDFLIKTARIDDEMSSLWRCIWGWILRPSICTNFMSCSHAVGYDLNEWHESNEYLKIKWNLSGTTPPDVKKKWSLQTGALSRQVRFPWDPMVNGNFHKMKNDLFKQGGLSRGDRCRQVWLYMYITEAISNISQICKWTRVTVQRVSKLNLCYYPLMAWSDRARVTPELEIRVTRG